jgi:PKD repeat protein
MFLSKPVILFTGLFLLIAFCTQAQPWMKYVDTKSGEPGFYEIQDAFNQYWAKREYEKGKGFKQFKRWEYFMEPRVDKEGHINSRAVIDAWTKTQNTSSAPKDETANWSHLGPVETPTNINSPSVKRGSGRLNCVTFHPSDSNIIYVGSPSGGLWKTTDGGNSWATTTDDLPSSIGISDIAIHPGDPQVIFIATGDGDARDTYSAGILKSTDGGATWTETPLPLDITNMNIIRRIKINPDNPDIMLAAGNFGIMRSEDGGTNWDIKASGHFKDIEINPGNSDILYASTYAYSGEAEIYHSVNAGMTWEQCLYLQDANRIELAVTPDNPTLVYAVASSAENSGYYGFYKSTNSGQNFTQVHDSTSLNLLGWSTDGNDTGGQGWYDLACAADPNDANTVYVGGVNTWKSVDGGLSWNIVSHWYGGDGVPYVHADHHSLDFSPLTGELYSGNDGGLHKTDNGGSSWADLSDGLEILQVYRMGASKTNYQRLLTGTQDNGTMRLDNGDWKAIIGGDGMECLVDYTNADIMYGTVYYGAIRRSMDGGYNFTDIKPSASGDGAWVTPFVIHPQDPETLYIGFKDVYKTTNRGDSWTVISDNLTGGIDIQSLAIAKSDPDVIYAATYNEIYRTTNGGGTWTNITNGLIAQSITYISVSAVNPEELWVTLSGYVGGEKVYFSDNGGDYWENYSDGLPNVPANCIVYEENSNNALYVGTDLGIYYRNSNMAQWTNYRQGLPNVIVNELEIQYNVNKIRAATYGRGVWESDLFELVAPPVADFTASVLNACQGEVLFGSTSSGAPNSYTWYFGDGNMSNEPIPTHTYQALGTYDVKLVVTNDLGADSITKQIVISQEDLVVDFLSNINQACQACEVRFTNISDELESYEWDFGDGNTSAEYEPEHTYDDEGSYTVSLTGSSALCDDVTETKTDFISFDPDNAAELNMPESGYGPQQACCEGYLYDNGGPDLNYSDNTNGLVKIVPADADQIEFTFMDFDVEAGPGGTCDYDRILIFNDLIPYDGYKIGEFCNNNPPSGSIITTEGKGLVRQITDGGVTEPGFKLFWQCLKVDFTHTADTRDYKTIHFSDISTNYPLTWAWDFGDGGTSDEQHPEHTYDQDGIYPVSLTITNDQGEYTEIKDIEISEMNIDNHQMLSEINVFPNPAKKEDGIYIQSQAAAGLHYELFSTRGKLVRSGNINVFEKAPKHIDTRNIAPGMYSLKISNNNKHIIKQVNIL